MHIKTQAIKDALDSTSVKYVGKTYKHYKGGVYKITGVYFDTVLDEPGLLYERVDGMHFNQLAESGISFGRPVSVFKELVQIHHGIKEPRFVRVVKEQIWKPI